MIPILLGTLVGNFEENMAKFLASGVALNKPFMGWFFGVNINLINVIQSGFQEILILLSLYIIMLAILLIVETKFLKEDGISALAISSIAGILVSVPMLIAQANSLI